MKVSELAARLQTDWEGIDTDISGAAQLESAESVQVSFVANRKAAAAASSSHAGCLIVPLEFPSGRTLIRSADPRKTFARAIGILLPRKRPAPGIHPTAVVADDAQIGDAVSIGPHSVVGTRAQIGANSVVGAHCTIGDGVRIGSDCVLYTTVTLYDGVIVGDRVILHSGCVLGADGFGFVLSEGRYEKFPQIGCVEIGDDVEIGANACVDRAALGVTRIGIGTKLDNMVHVGHNCHIGNHVVVAAQTGFSGGVVIEDYAVVGGQVGIGDKARVETGAVLGSGCGILTSKIVRKGQVVWGTPARPLKEYLLQLANLARLPQLRQEVEELKRQVSELKRLA